MRFILSKITVTCEKRHDGTGAGTLNYIVCEGEHPDYTRIGPFIAAPIIVVRAILLVAVKANALPPISLR